MAKATEPAVTPADIFFELDQFERSDGWIRLSGRWFGVRGRRFVRPTLTVALDGDRVRALADLEDKPWAAEDGEAWTASFPLRQGGRVAQPELSVAPDITIQLPPPSGKRGRSQRLAALPRRDAMTASWGDLAPVVEAPARKEEPGPQPESGLDVDGRQTVAAAEPAAGPEPAAGAEPGAGAEPAAGAEPGVPDAPATGAEDAHEPDPTSPVERAPDAQVGEPRARPAEANETVAARAGELDSVRAELDSVRGELESTRARLESAQAELGSSGAELEAARRQLARRDGESESVEAERAAARSAREAALRNAARAEAEKEQALTRAAEAEADRDAMAVEKAQLTATLEQSRGTVELLGRERDEAVASRGAALVMRGATQAMPAYERHVGWLRRALAMLVPLGAIIGILIAVGVL